MTEYIDEEDSLHNDNGVTGGPPEAGWPYAVKPAWVRDLLDLWERDKLVTLLLELATDGARSCRSPAISCPMPV